MELSLGEMDLGPHSRRGVCTLDLNLGQVDHGLTLGEMDLGSHSWIGRPWTSFLERWTMELTLVEVDLGTLSWRDGP